MVSLISIVTPSLNHGDFIAQAIQSCLIQQPLSFEHVVMDGGSKDQTLSVLKKYPHLAWVSESDQGKTDALNKGFKKTKGEILGWLCADDYFLPDTFRKVIAYFDADPALNVLVGRAKVVDQDGNFLFDQEEPGPQGFTHQGMIRFWNNPMLPQPSIFFRRRVLEEIGFLDESLPSYMDYEFFLRLSSRYSFKRVPDFFSCIRFHDGSESVRDMASGRLHRILLPISKKYWGKSGSAVYWGHQLSFVRSWPGLAWRAHYESFALQLRGALNLKPRDYPDLKGLWKARRILFAYPLPFLVAVFKKMMRTFSPAARGNHGI